MKRFVFLMLSTIIFSIIAVNMPLIAKAAIPEVEVMQTRPQAYQDKISATGKLEEVEKSEITADLPIVASKVYVGLGDEVESGKVIADVDLEKTKEAILSMADMYEMLPSNLSALLTEIELNTEQITQMIPNQIVADYSGTISTLNIRRGAIVTPKEVIATISNLSDIQAVLHVSEEYASKVKAGQAVRMKISAMNNKKVKGTVRQIAPVAHETLVGTSKQTVLNVYISLDDSYSSLRSGYSIVGTIYTGEDEQVTTVPYTAIDQEESGTEFVYLYRNGKAQKRCITTGREMNESVEVLAGLDDHEWIIADKSRIENNKQYVDLKGIKDV